MALHFGEKLCKSPFTHFRGSVADSLYIFWFQSVACFTIICQMALLPSRLSVAVENDASVHPVADKIKLCCNSCVPYCDWWSHVYAGVWYAGAMCMLVCVWWSCVYAGVWYGGAMCMLVCVWWSCVYAGVWLVELCVCWSVIGWAVCMLVCDRLSCVYAGVWLVEGFEYPAVVEFAPFLKVPKKRARKPDPRKATIESGQTLLLSVCLLHTSIITCEIT